MKGVFITLALLATLSCPAQGEETLSRFLDAPEDVSLGMRLEDLEETREGLFPGPSPPAEIDKRDLKTVMEIEGMGMPGHRSFYYLIENGKLQGLIRTESLVGLEAKEQKRIASSNYKRLVANVGGEPSSSGILRKDGMGFSRVTLETWRLEREPWNLFHVATNFESTVGIISRDTSFPISQLFVPDSDERFENLLNADPAITDIPREEILSAAPKNGFGLDQDRRGENELEPSSEIRRARPVDAGDSSSQIKPKTSDVSAKPSVPVFFMMVVFVGVSVYVWRKVKNART